MERIEMQEILVAFVVLALCFAGIGIRIILLKDGKFRGSCSSQNVTGDDSCSICGKKAEDMSDCKGPDIDINSQNIKIS